MLLYVNFAKRTRHQATRTDLTTESQDQETRQENESGGTSTSCGAVFARWLLVEKIELVVGDAAERDKEDDDDEEDDDMMPRRSQKRHVFDDIVIEEAESKNEILVADDDEKEEESRVAFSVVRKAPELIVPARSHATLSRQVMQLSDIDDQQGLRFQVPLIFFYKNNPSMEGKDPIKVIKEAISRTLVFYYPIAGRLREGFNRKLMVDCTDEGVMFTEADANLKLDQLGDHEIQPPSPYLDQLLPFDDPSIIGRPLMSFQVTRLICGGFILAFRFNHTMCDAFGLTQFLKAMEEMAQGTEKPSLLPVWERQLLNARESPRVTCIHHEYYDDEIEDDDDSTQDFLRAMDPNENLHKSFFFGPKEIQALRDHLPLDLKKSSTFELITACVWKCRTAALEIDPDEIVRVSCAVNARGKNYNMHLTPGYYGNAFAYPAVCSKAHLLCENPLEYAVELVKEAKAKMSEEYIRSLADLMVIRGRPGPIFKGNMVVSDNSRIGFEEINFGWGKPVYGGLAGAVSFISFYVNYQKSDGEIGKLVPIWLPPSSMVRFEQELNKMITQSAL
ncbi:hypothetical protein Q3G72_029732 [Acer saccharum]|nr:hypothetical protein Q3G72_029732 [Acer saccharum]